MVKIKCSTKDEREIADFVKPRLTQIGFEVTEDNVGEKIGGTSGNIIAYLKGSVPTAPRLLFSGHLDCVEPCENIKPIIKDGIITSSGDTILGGDNKAGLAAAMEAIRTILENKIPHGDIQLIFTVAEEGGVNGSKNMDKNVIKADYGYILDSSGAPGKIITKAPGQNKIDVTIHGKTAHAGLAPEEGVNAIVVAGKAMAVLKDGRIDFETTANVGYINGGSVTNIVPDKVTLKCEARSHNTQKLQEQTAHMIKTFETVAEANNAKAEIEVEESYDSYSIAEEAKVVEIAKKAALNIGLTPATAATGGGSDANFFNKYGLPSVVLANGTAKVHTTSEYLAEKDLYNTGRFVVEIIKETAAMSR
jgi:tripeptide aminopeptidase